MSAAPLLIAPHVRLRDALRSTRKEDVALERRLWIHAYLAKYGRITFETLCGYWPTSKRAYTRDLASLRAAGARIVYERGAMVYYGFDPAHPDPVREWQRRAIE